MENDYFKAIVSVVLPAQILDYFIVVGVEQTKTEIHISLDECNNGSSRLCTIQVFKWRHTKRTADTFALSALQVG